MIFAKWQKIILGLSLIVVVFLFLGVEERAVLDFALCSGLDQDNLPLDRRDKFSIEERSVICWVFLEEVKAGDELKWEFSAPGSSIYESILMVEEDKKYVGVQGELSLERYRGEILPNQWQVSFFINQKKYLELPFTLVRSSIEGSPSLEEAIRRTALLLKEFGYQVYDVNYSPEDGQAFIRMEMVSTDLNQDFWNQVGIGLESLQRIFPEASWFLVQLIREEQYVLDFQVRAIDFDLWRKGRLNTDEFWKKKVVRSVYNLRERKREDTENFYRKTFGVIY